MEEAENGAKRTLAKPVNNKYANVRRKSVTTRNKNEN